MMHSFISNDVVFFLNNAFVFALISNSQTTCKVMHPHNEHEGSVHVNTGPDPSYMSPSELTLEHC